MMKDEWERKNDTQKYINFCKRQPELKLENDIHWLKPKFVNKSQYNMLVTKEKILRSIDSRNVSNLVLKDIKHVFSNNFDIGKDIKKERKIKKLMTTNNKKNHHTSQIIDLAQFFKTCEKKDHSLIQKENYKMQFNYFFDSINFIFKEETDILNQSKSNPENTNSDSKNMFLKKMGYFTIHEKSDDLNIRQDSRSKFNDKKAINVENCDDVKIDRIRHYDKQCDEKPVTSSKETSLIERKINRKNAINTDQKPGNKSWNERKRNLCQRNKKQNYNLQLSIWI